MVIIMIFDTRLKILRLEKDKTRIEIAKILNIGLETYDRYESESLIIPMKHLITLSNYYNVSIDYLFGLTNIKQYSNINQNINNQIIGKRLKIFRASNQDMKQSILADHLGISQSNIVKYEQGKTLISTDCL